MDNLNYNAVSYSPGFKTLLVPLTAPSNTTVTSLSGGTSATINWTASSDLNAGAVVSYSVSINGEHVLTIPICTGQECSTTVTDLSQASQNTVLITASDNYNQTRQGEPVEFWTLGMTTPPSGTAVLNAVTGNVVLTWNASQFISSTSGTQSLVNAIYNVTGTGGATPFSGPFTCSQAICTAPAPANLTYTITASYEVYTSGALTLNLMN